MGASSKRQSHLAGNRLVSFWRVVAFEVLKAGCARLEAERNDTERAIAVLSDVDLGNTLLVGVFVVQFFAIDEHHDVGVLLD